MDSASPLLNHLMNCAIHKKALVQSLSKMFLVYMQNCTFRQKTRLTNHNIYMIIEKKELSRQPV